MSESPGGDDVARNAEPFRPGLTAAACAAKIRARVARGCRQTPEGEE